jgi:hypothetical protein
MRIEYAMVARELCFALAGAMVSFVGDRSTRSGM